MLSTCRRWILVTLTVAGLLASSLWYLITNPQREAARFIRVLQRVQVGQTSTKELSDLIDGSRLGGVRLVCSPDLERLAKQPPTVGTPYPTTPGDPGTLVWAGPGPYECRYDFTVTNALLHRLRLAPLSGMTGNIITNDKVVTGIGFHSDISVGNLANCNIGSTNCDFGYVAHIDVGQRMERMRLNAHRYCDQPICMKRINITPPGYPNGVMIDVSASAPISERNRVFALNTSCFTKIGGCKSEQDLLPISELK